MRRRGRRRVQVRYLVVLEEGGVSSDSGGVSNGGYAWGERSEPAGNIKNSKTLQRHPSFCASLHSKRQTLAAAPTSAPTGLDQRLRPKGRRGGSATGRLAELRERARRYVVTTAAVWIQTRRKRETSVGTKRLKDLGLGSSRCKKPDRKLSRTGRNGHSHANTPGLIANLRDGPERAAKGPAGRTSKALLVGAFLVWRNPLVETSSSLDRFWARQVLSLSEI
jgi:hypothetical protein